MKGRQDVVGGHQEHGEDHQSDLDMLEAPDTPHLLQEVVEDHEQDLAGAAGLRPPAPSNCFLSFHSEGGEGVPFVSLYHRFLRLL